MINESLIYEILSLVDEISEGKVATYGQIAKLIGREKNSRLAGKVLSMSESYGKYPCHRVVNPNGTDLSALGGTAVFASRRRRYLERRKSR